MQSTMLRDIFMMLRDISEPAENRSWSNLPEELAKTANGAACFNYASALVDELVKLLASKK